MSITLAYIDDFNEKHLSIVSSIEEVSFLRELYEDLQVIEIKS